ncbi:autotransporter outer membrane beta-barrel domain-containing protein [Geobacter argillaceus]|uniref:Outer membrane autotransporter protein n=1 Tax=Geobacter argillaceus TaxID=345631 RepID=A0A562WSZ1_9BACT|nr:autotransporter outer membrane beta-barrel domain-containing protein [Geobacter argillaceus]TWJ33507.1 outer membrane autotransporter protein [Geobacter argillaceus]
MLRRTKGVFIVLAALLALWSAPALAAPRFGGMTELYLYPYIQYFHWQEESGGRKLLTESGPLYGIGTAVGLDLLRTDTSGSLFMKAKGELFGGVIDYDGETQAPSSLPVKTDVTYVGGKGELNLGWSFPAGRFAIQPFSGIGYRIWLRDLHDSSTTDRNGQALQVQGYTEVWESAYAKLGLNLSHTFDNNWRLFLEGGVSYPFYNTNSVDIVGDGTTTVRPDGRWSAFGEAGIRTGKVRTAIFYQGYRTDQSPAVRISQSTSILQPRSTEDVVGVSVGYCFR